MFFSIILKCSILGMIVYQFVPSAGFPTKARDDYIKALQNVSNNNTRLNVTDVTNDGIITKNGTTKVRKVSVEFKGGLSIFERFDGTPFSFYYQSLDKPKKQTTKQTSTIPLYIYYIPIFGAFVVAVLIAFRLVSWMNADYQHIERTNIVIMLPEESSTHIVYTRL